LYFLTSYFVGITATNIRGVTIHSFAGIRSGNTLKEMIGIWKKEAEWNELQV
jgi:hypothetical protein